MSHGLLIPPQIYLNQGSKLAFWSGQIGHLMASGTGAVALFFVVSGLCIHLGRTTAEQNPLLFLTRRVVRIGIPLLTALLITAFGGDVARELEKGVLWSVFCELGYYLTYPLLLVVLRYWSLEGVLAAVLATSAALLMTLPPHPLVWEYGLWTPLICYPLWIMGAMIAEQVGTIAPCRNDHVWHWRIGLIFAAATCSLVRHMAWAADLSVLTYVVVGLLAIPFLRREIAHGMVVAPSIWAERLGGASYSIYLVHRFPLWLVEHAFAGWSQWIVAPTELALVGACSFSFFFLCEGPAVKLARSISFEPIRWKRSSSAL